MIRVHHELDISIDEVAKLHPKEICRLFAMKGHHFIYTRPLSMGIQGLFTCKETGIEYVVSWRLEPRRVAGEPVLLTLEAEDIRSIIQPRLQDIKQKPVSLEDILDISTASEGRSSFVSESRDYPSRGIIDSTGVRI